MTETLTKDREVVPADDAASQGLHRVVIVGGGAGGLELATTLGNRLGKRRKAHISLVDRSRTHVWKPLLYEIAAGSMDADREELDYLAQAHWHGFRYRFGEINGLDRARKLVKLAATFDEEGRRITPERQFSYDTLVIAIGSQGNDFGTPGAKDHAIMLDTPEQAERFNRRLVNACLRAHTQPEPIRPGQLHVVIVGAGSTGTELAAELNRTVRGVIAYGMDKIDPDKDIKITLLEAAPRILPALPERMAKATIDILKNLKVDVKTGARVTEIRSDGVMLRSGEFVPSELVVWAAGVKGPDILSKLDGLEVSPSNQLVIRDTLQTTRDDNVFAIGDCAYLVPEGQKDPIPPRAQAAHQMASHMAAQVARLLKNEPLTPFRYRDFGSLVSLGQYTAVGSLMGFLSGRRLFIEGWLARMMYRSLYKMHLAALHGPWKVFVNSFANLFSSRTEPLVKLH